MIRNKTVRKMCCVCRRVVFLKVKADDYERFISNEKMIFPFPYLTNAERELMLSGICGDCIHFESEFDFESESEKGDLCGM